VKASQFLVLGAMSAFGPLCIDLYLPAFPTLAGDLDASSVQVQLTVTTCLVGLAGGQLVAGPLSDRFGRKRPLLVGVGLFVLASLLCSVAPDTTTLLVARGLQGVAGSAGIVIARAVARDLYSGPELVRFFSLLMLVNGVTPILAPSLGAQLLEVMDWRGLFVVLAGVGLVMLLSAVVWLPETLPPAGRREGGVRDALVTYRRLLGEGSFVAVLLTSGLVFGALFVYIGGSSFLLQESYGLSAQQYALAFGLNACGLIATAQVTARLVARAGARRLLGLGVLQAVTGGLFLLVGVVADAPVGVVLAALFVTVSSVGVVAPTGAALALADHAAVAGSASALLGVANYLLGSLLAPLSGLGGRLAFATVLLAGPCLAALCFQRARPRPVMLEG
jgi:DHA1 family bicyclomycin/chloramphenicol resistance-like MFS transporter